MPAVAAEIDDPGRRSRRDFRGKSERIGFLEDLVVMPDEILVERAFAQAGYKQLPEAAGNVFPHGMPPAVPAIEIAQDAHRGGVGGPDGEINPFHAVDRAKLRPSFS